MKRIVNVATPEKENGNIEYKRQVYQPSASRLRSLATQMSYRLDEGSGCCHYYIGVEDDGCHSLLDYRSVSESARVLECIARSLNAVVVKRNMMQKEVTLGEDGELKDMSGDESSLVNWSEPSVFGHHYASCNTYGNDQSNDDDKEEKSDSVDGDTAVRIRKDSKDFTRCELVLQRVETHLLDPTPVALADLANGGREKDGNVYRSKGGEEEKSGVTESCPSTEMSSLKLSTKGSTLSNGTGEATQHEVFQSEVATTYSPSTTTSKTATATMTTSKTSSTPPTTTSVIETLSTRNVRVAVVGNVDAGKSTLIGTLTTSSLDDGRGRSRTTIMKHRHEIESGRTSTATVHLMGFRHNGDPVAGRDSVRANKRKSEDEIARESYRIVTLMDLAGHEKYLKTTIHGVSSGFADYSLILVNSRHPPTHMTQHHLNLCCSFGIPTIVVFTKIDGCPEHALKTSKEELGKMMRSPEVGRRPFAVRNEQDIATCVGKMHTLAPIFETSCVSGEGLGLLRKMLFALPKRRRHENKVNRSFEFLVEDIFNVPGVGAVVSGFVNAGSLTVGSNANVYVGPLDDGSFIKTVAKSAHIARINTSHITAGQSACLAFSLKKEDRHKLRRGMVVLCESPTCTREFDAEICVLKGEGTTIRRSYQAYVHVLNVRQSAFAKNIEMVNHSAIGLTPSHVENMENDDGEVIVLRPGSRAKVRFVFAKRPEYVRPGMRMLFRDGRVRGVGIITGIPEIQPVN